METFVIGLFSNLLFAAIMYAIGHAHGKSIGYWRGKRDAYDDARQMIRNVNNSPMLLPGDDGETRIVVETDAIPESAILGRLKDLVARMESGESISAVRVTREQTPDGPMHTFDEVKLQKRGVE